MHYDTGVVERASKEISRRLSSLSQKSRRCVSRGSSDSGSDPSDQLNGNANTGWEGDSDPATNTGNMGTIAKGSVMDKVKLK